MLKGFKKRKKTVAHKDMLNDRECRKCHQNVPAPKGEGRKAAMKKGRRVSQIFIGSSNRTKEQTALKTAQRDAEKITIFRKQQGLGQQAPY